MRSFHSSLVFVQFLVLFGVALNAAAITPTTPPTEGETIRFEDIDKLKAFLPEEVWQERRYFFWNDMKMEIGPAQRDYSPPAVYQNATQTYASSAHLGPEGSLEDYVAGQPFPMSQIDCKADPDAGTKIMWNFDYQWEGGGSRASFYYSYWDRGERQQLFYEGSSSVMLLAHRPEKAHLEARKGNVISERERRKRALYVEVDGPGEARGTKLLSYRYKASDKAPSEAPNDDMHVWVPALRRVRRISQPFHWEPVAGTVFALDDMGSFGGHVTKYDWTCLETRKILAPVNTKIGMHPNPDELDFGPFGLSFANDRWELRDAVAVLMVPKNPGHPYSKKVIYIDRQTMRPLYSAAYDNNGSLWKVMAHVGRWSEQIPEDYLGWEEVPEPRDLIGVADLIIDVKTASGNRIEFWDAIGTPFPQKRMKRYVSLGRLGGGR